MEFEFFDPTAPLAISRRKLPHWFQAGAAYFVTFRTADSLPAAVVERWKADRYAWLQSHGIDPSNPSWEACLRRLPREAQVDYFRTFNAEFHRLLDAGYGDCILKRPEAGNIVATALKHFNGQRYHLSDFVIMPNHVHILLGLIGNHSLAEVCYSWKKFTAGRINDLIGRQGHFWQGESFDHLVRSTEQFEYFRGYIAMNPQRASLKPGEFILYQGVQDGRT
jgi:REP element-mobilizing transposase RayT